MQHESDGNLTLTVTQNKDYWNRRKIFDFSPPWGMIDTEKIRDPSGHPDEGETPDL